MLGFGSTTDRAAEIGAFVAEHRGQIYSHMVLDDVDLFGSRKDGGCGEGDDHNEARPSSFDRSRFVQTTGSLGLQASDTKKALKILDEPL